ncbi:Beta-1,3-galactosyltransferase 2 [Amphibalanus amphitrite]|uniref:Hexosyltransferase n=1 Tax=Amphibalanus amphitrite TaxID=1232801 RepID=A0A6A4XHP8_AMPAM|nr:Beta-1,3-galactosyltransferase 2 [Amphibalanus amphitrite]
MELRSAAIRRLLVVFVCGVFGYVVFYNSLLMDRRGSLLHDAHLSYGGAAVVLRDGMVLPDADGALGVDSGDLQSLMGARQMWTLGDAGMGPSEMPSTPAAAAGTAAPVKDSIRSRLEPGFRIANGGRCPERGRDLRLVILITTAPGHQRQRKAIRLTWGGSVAQRRDVTLLFFLGRAAEPHQSAVDEEQQTYGDIVQGNFVDAYNNLTLKSAVMLEWLDTFCPEARMILKTDDDMFINTDNLLKFVDVHSKDTNKLFGRLARRWKPNRSVKSKYYLSPESFAGKYLPDFVTGPAYVMTGDLVKPLYQATLDAKFLTLEDVLVTGVVADKLHIKRVHAKEFINDRIKADTCKFATSVSVHMVKFEEQFDIWKRIQDGRTRCPQYVPTGG